MDFGRVLERFWKAKILNFRIFLEYFFDTNRYKIEVGEKMRKKRKACAPRRRERASRQVYPSQQNPLHDGVLVSFY